MLRRTFGFMSLLQPRTMKNTPATRSLVTATEAKKVAAVTSHQKALPLEKIGITPTQPTNASLLSLLTSGALTLLKYIAFATDKNTSKANTPLKVTDLIVLRVRPIIYEIYEKLSQGDVEGANEFATKNLLTITDAGNAIEIGNLLLRHDKPFRDFIQQSIDQCIQISTPLMKYDYLSPDHQPVAVFRSVVINGKYGDPKFTDGFTASLFNRRLTTNGIVVAPSINTFVAEENEKGEYNAKLLIPNRYDKLGFTFGPLIAMTMNLFHALDERYTYPSERGKSNGKRVIYLLAITKGYNVAHAIHEGAGYIRDQEKGRQGEKGTSNPEDAAEVVGGPFIEGKQVLGYRIIDMNNNLGPFMHSAKASKKLLDTLAKKDAHVEIFLTAKSVKHAQELETLLIDDPKKLDGYTKKYVGLMRKNKELSKRIQSEARGQASDELLHVQVHGHRKSIAADTMCADTKEHLEVFQAADQHKKRVSSGDLIVSHQRFFHSLKAKSEAELQDRAIRAKKLLAGKADAMSGPILQPADQHTHKRSSKK